MRGYYVNCPVVCDEFMRMCCFCFHQDNIWWTIILEFDFLHYMKSLKWKITHLMYQIRDKSSQFQPMHSTLCFIKSELEISWDSVKPVTHNIMSDYNIHEKKTHCVLPLIWQPSANLLLWLKFDHVIYSEELCLELWGLQVWRIIDVDE